MVSANAFEYFIDNSFLLYIANAARALALRAAHIGIGIWWYDGTSLCVCARFIMTEMMA